MSRRNICLTRVSIPERSTLFGAYFTRVSVTVRLEIDRYCSKVGACLVLASTQHPRIARYSVGTHCLEKHGRLIASTVASGVLDVGEPRGILD